MAWNGVEKQEKTASFNHTFFAPLPDVAQNHPFTQLFPMKNIFASTARALLLPALSLFLGLLAGPRSFAQAAGNYQYERQQQSNAPIQNFKQQALLPSTPQESKTAHTVISDVYQLNITASALKNVAADSQMAIFNITQIGPDATRADSLVSGRVRKFIEGMKRIGIPEKDIFIDMISQVPVYEMEVTKKIFSKTFNEVPAGIELQKNIHVRYHDGNLLDKIVAVAAQSEIYDIVKVEYFVNGTEAIYAELREKAIACVLQKINSYKALGIKLDTSYRVLAEDIAVVYPYSNYQTYQGFSSSSIEAMNTRKSVGVTQVRKPTTMFYNKVPYEQFDIVLNPTFLEPPVQFTYSISVKFLTPPKPNERTIAKREFVWLTPDGRIQTLKVE